MRWRVKMGVPEAARVCRRIAAGLVALVAKELRKGQGRRAHVRPLAERPMEVAEWFAKLIDAGQAPAEATLTGNIRSATISLGDVGLHILPDVAGLKPKERTGVIQPAGGGGIDHIATSFENLDAGFRRVKAMGAPIERPIAMDEAFGVRSFFVRAANGVLVEVVEAMPLPEAMRR